MNTFKKLDKIVNQILLEENITGLNKKNYSLIFEEWESTRSTWLFVLGEEYERIEKTLILTIKSLKRNDVLNQIGI